MTRTIVEYLEGKESTIINNQTIFVYNRQENTNRGSRSTNFDKSTRESTYTFSQSGFFQVNNSISNVGSVSAGSSSDGMWHSYYGTLYAYLYLYDEQGNLVKELMPLHNYGSDNSVTTDTFFAKPGYYLFAKITSSSTNAAWGADDSFWSGSLTGYAFND